MSATAVVGAQATTTTTRTAGRWLGALAGLAFTILFFMGIATLNIPLGASDAKLVEWWADSGNQTTAIVSMYLFIVAGLCFLLFLTKLRSRLLTAEGGTGELTSLVVASGAVFVAMLLVAAASRGVIGFAVKSPGDNESLPGSRHAPLPAADRLRRARHRRPARSRRRNGDDVVADRADSGIRPLAGVARRRVRARDRRRGGGSRRNVGDPGDADLGPGRQRRDVARTAVARCGRPSNTRRRARRARRQARRRTRPCEASPVTGLAPRRVRVPNECGWHGVRHQSAPRTSESVCWLLRRQHKTPPIRGFREADDRARTIDLLHGKHPGTVLANSHLALLSQIQSLRCPFFLVVSRRLLTHC